MFQDEGYGPFDRYKKPQQFIKYKNKKQLNLKQQLLNSNPV